ncbi:YfjI family protein [Streptomyces sp. SL13]|uniref:YfjI family protein n=1 Tax=Streptantibioticus silvisoli TaxID=2705255 RepID=A0AA90H6R6_9ACTN|nr:YfjI family protein [Streptantibioticus silvisoli]MDI5971507.1 YfjI family protein [Streptantibioticus silvisoli]
MTTTPSEDLWAGFDLAADPADTAPVWDEPVPLTPRRDLPAFPVDALPGWLAAMVTGVAEETQTPADLAGCLALAVIGTAAGGRCTICVRGRWREPVNIYTAVALDPGNRKSAVFSLMTEPLLAVEKVMVERSGAIRAEAETTARLAKAAADKAAARAANADDAGRADATAEAVALALAAEETTVPAVPQLFADDVTPESLATLLTEQDGRIGVLSPEGGIFEIIAGRYSGTPNMEIFLKGHAGDMVRVNRQGRPAQHVERPAVTMGLAVQPEVLESIGRIKGADGRGLLARFLYALPDSLVGHRNLTPDLLPQDVADTYTERLGALTLTMADWTDPALLTLSPEADAVLLAYQRTTESRLGKGGSLAPVVKWASKRDGAVARLAGLLHLAQHPRDAWTMPIDAATMAAATRLGDYFTAHALTVFDAMSADPAQDTAHTLLTHLRETGLTGFTRRELFRGLPRGDFAVMADLDPALNLLEDHGWVRQRPTPTPRGGGRPPSPRYDAHPRLTRTTTA